MVLATVTRTWSPLISDALGNLSLLKVSKHHYVYNVAAKRQSLHQNKTFQEITFHRRLLFCGAVPINSFLTLMYGLEPLPALAEDESKGQDGNVEGVLGAMKSILYPNEKTKSGKVLPKAYLNSAREVLKTLRESLKEDPKDITKFRRTADAAKESIRQYLSDWKGQKSVVNEESYVVLEKVLRSLASFYSKAGPSAPLPEKIKSEILDNLGIAEEFL